MIRLKKQPKILETKKEIIKLVRANQKLLNLTITDRKMYYLRGYFLLHGVEYHFLLQYYVRYFPRVHYIEIENKELSRFYKHLHPTELKKLLNDIESIVLSHKQNANKHPPR
jgi:hypothetical protein